MSSDDRALLPRAAADDGEALESRVQDVLLQICQKRSLNKRLTLRLGARA